MASLSAFPATLNSVCKSIFKTHRTLVVPRSCSIHFQTENRTAMSFRSLALAANKRTNSYGVRRLRSVEEETAVLAEEQADGSSSEQVAEQEAVQEPVAVPVSPSDTLTMYFQADGMLNETEIPKVTKALEEAEGVSNLKIQLLEGIASVELTKQTTVQATGVASNLVETIQGAGFRLQTLNLSFEDEEDILVS